jgi:predicted CXXCH cytochrome family protein
MVFRLSFLVWSLCSLCPGSDGEQNQFAGPAACASCHRAINDSQSKTAMANTWHGSAGAFLPPDFYERKAEAGGKATYEVRRTGDVIELSVVNSGKAEVTAPVRAMVGGKRHGVSFLLGIHQFGGISLERPAMIEARYALSPTGSLLLSPGFLKETGDREDELGRVLSPAFEQRCVSCHGKPDTLGAGKQGGVRCESCHGPGLAHVNSFRGVKGAHPSVRPEHLEGAKIMEVCAQCHNGLSTAIHSDPMPEDVLVSSQVPALRNSECFIESREKLTCTACHNPHADSAKVTTSSVPICLGCHSTAAPQHAAICPVNRTEGCITCHMPSVESDSFRLTDHWIRVHPSPGMKILVSEERFRSQVVPEREFLRMIKVETDDKAATAVQRLAMGESFSSVAHQLSTDPTAPGGGYVGEMRLSDMDAQLAAAAARLPQGENSGVIAVGSDRIILHRLPRDFRWEADRLFLEASALNARGDRAGAIEKDRQALEVYPYLLRGLVLMASILGQAGDASRASEILQFAVQFYPKDALTQFDLALTLGKQPALQIEALRRAIELDPDMIAAYQSLGAALYSAGQKTAAIDVFRRGLQIDPLSAVLYYNLGLALKEQGDEAGAGRALDLATKLDPEIASRGATSH